MSLLLLLKEKIKSSPVWKPRVHRMMFSNARPRLWVKWLLNPFVFRHGKGAVIRRQTLLNVSPVHRFHVGAESTIENYTVVDNGAGDVLIGDRVRVGLRSTLIGPVQIGNDTIVAQNVVLSGLSHNYQDPSRPIRLQGITARPIRIAEGAWIGANVVVTAGVSIGRNSVVGAGSVVTRDVPDYCMAAGNPARVIKRFDAADSTFHKYP